MKASGKGKNVAQGKFGKLLLTAAFVLAAPTMIGGCAQSAPAPYAPPPPPPPPPPPTSSIDEAAYREAMRRQVEKEQRASSESARQQSAMAAYEQAKREMAAAAKKWKDAREGKFDFASAAAAGESAQPDNGAGEAAGKVPCPQLGGLALPAECTHYATLQASLKKGIAAFDPPRSMHMGKDYPVKLVIGSEEASSQVIDAATDAGEVKTVNIRLGSWICAELLASQFEVVGERRLCRERGLSQTMSWDWTVSPVQDGRLKLGVKVESFAEKGGKPLDAIDSRMIAVDVEADALGRFDMMVSRLTESLGGVRSMLLALLSALGVLSVVIWRVRNLGKKPEQDALKDLTAT